MYDVNARSFNFRIDRLVLGNYKERFVRNNCMLVGDINYEHIVSWKTTVLM